jgi:endonuclease YncB( thermonuclease family)
MHHTSPHRRAAIAAAVCCLALAAAGAHAQGGKQGKGAPIEGVIAKVIDGDSLVLQPKTGAPIEVRLRDIDAPEICQAGGPEAKAMLERLALGKEAALATAGRDTYGRTVGLVTVEGQSLSKQMVAEGHAWSNRSRFDRGPLMKEERMAIALKRGLHAAGGAQNPKDFRKANGPCK